MEAEARQPRERLLVRLLKLAAMISRPMQEAVALPHALSLNELRILMCLGGEGPCAGHDITRLMGIPPMNVSRALATLGERGLIQPVVDGVNRRRKPMQLSERGEAGYQAMGGDLAAIATDLLGMLDEHDAAALRRIVDMVIGRLETWPRP